MLPAVLVALGVFGFWRVFFAAAGVLTPERAALYQTVLKYERNPKTLLYWSNWFAKQNLPEQAAALKARSQIPHVHGEGKAMRAEIVRRAMASQNPAAIAEVAGEFECMGYGATSDFLRHYAQGLELDRQIWIHTDDNYPMGDWPLPGDGAYDPPTYPPTLEHLARMSQVQLGGEAGYDGYPVAPPNPEPPPPDPHKPPGSP
jgi:hypothetical protein